MVLSGLQDLKPERRDEILLAIAKKVEKYNLITPAILFLQMSKPLSFVGSQAVLFSAPIAGAFIDERLIEDFGQIMADRENVERLLTLLEDREEIRAKQEKLEKDQNKLEKARTKLEKGHKKIDN
ncbi:MAG: Uncharacterized protein FD169_778 [Bacillota bacterium]|nr:MAG: Uncharacterized protein FD169_778 [Bacillota bacterium]MBS3951235.1 hypothetical protein [Peptococcaceae bacterium]